MSMRRSSIVLLVAAGCAYAQDPGSGRGRMGRFEPGMAGPLPGARLVGAVAGMPGRVVQNAPYSADVVTETTQTLPDGNHIRQTSTARMYRDSQGRVRNEQSLSGLGSLTGSANLPQVVFITDPVAGVTYAVNAQNKTATRSQWQGRGGAGGQAQQAAAGHGRGPQGAGPDGGRWNRAAAGRRPNGNAKTESLGRQTVEGVPADGTRSTLTIPAGQMGNEQPIQIVSEQWYSPDLQAIVLSKHWDPRAGETVYRLTNIDRTEPAASLFQPPADYKVTEANRASRSPINAH